MNPNRKMEEALSLEDVRSRFSYDPETGEITRIKGKTDFIGKRAGSLRPNGYRFVQIKRRFYAEHRLVWFYVHGCWPTNYIDHINRNRSDNRIENLRECTKQQNSSNKKQNRGSASGLVGVKYRSDRGKWRADITVGGKRHYLGLHSTKEAAFCAYELAARKMLGEFYANA
jgi:hypothetical protein